MAPLQTVTGDYRCESHDARLGDHEVRIRILEKVSARWAGVIVGASVAGSFAAQLVGRYLLP